MEVIIKLYGSDIEVIVRGLIRGFVRGVLVEFMSRFVREFLGELVRGLAGGFVEEWSERFLVDYVEIPHRICGRIHEMICGVFIREDFWKDSLMGL